MKKLVIFIILLFAAICCGVKIESGDTSRKVYFVAVDSTDYITRETSLTSPSVYYSIDGGSATAMTDPNIEAIDATNMPGVFKVDVNEVGMVTLSAGVEFAELVLHITATEMAPVTLTIEVYDGFTTEVTAILADTEIIADANNNTEAEIAAVSTLITDVNTNAQADLDAILADTTIIADVNTNLTADVNNLWLWAIDANDNTEELISGSGSDASLINDVNDNLITEIEKCKVRYRR